MALRWRIFMRLRTADYLKNRQLYEVLFLFLAMTSNLLIKTNLAFVTFFENIFVSNVLSAQRSVINLLSKDKRKSRIYHFLKNTGYFIAFKSSQLRRIIELCSKFTCNRRNCQSGLRTYSHSLPTNLS